MKSELAALDRKIQLELAPPTPEVAEKEKDENNCLRTNNPEEKHATMSGVHISNVAAVQMKSPLSESVHERRNTGLKL